MTASTSERPIRSRAVGRLASDWASFPMTDRLAIVAVVVLGIGSVPGIVEPSWAVRTALVLLVMPVGLVVLGAACGRDGPARWGLLVIVVSVLAALGAMSPGFALLGTLGPHNSVLFYAGGVSMWALGRDVTPTGRSFLAGALALVLGLNAALAVLQVTLSIDGGVWAAASGRATGFVGTPIALGALAAGGVAYRLAIDDAAGRTALSWVAALAGCAALSGSRSGVLVVIGAVVVHLTVRRNGGALRAGIAALAGLTVGTLVSTSSDGSDVVGRVRSRGGDGRLDIWRYGLRAFLDRPLFGWGPGHHGTAVRRYFSLDFTRSHAWTDDISAWSDAHNLVLTLLVTTGLCGLVVAVGFVAHNLFRVEAVPFAAFAVAVAAVWMVEPATVHTLPLAMLVLGAAVGPRLRRAPERAARAATAVGLVVALAFAAPLVVVRGALREQDGSTAAAAALFSWRDPEVADLVAERLTVDVLLERAGSDGQPSTSSTLALSWSARVTEWMPGSSWAWTRHAERQIVLGVDPTGALDAARRLDPWNADAWLLELRFAELIGDEARRDVALAKVCALELSACGGDQEG